MANSVVKGCGIAVAAVGVILVAGLAIVGPGLMKRGKELYAPVTKLRSASEQLEALSQKYPWTEPAEPSATAEQLDRFLAVRHELAELYRSGKGMPQRRQNPSFDEVKQALDEVGASVDAQTAVFQRAEMSPAEYRYLERLIYRRWRGALRDAGTYPLVQHAAAREIEAAAQGEPAAVAARLQALAEELRARRPDAPKGIPDALHDLLLARLEAIEGSSLEGVETIPLAR